jgi:hypothetical protein
MGDNRHYIKVIKLTPGYCRTPLFKKEKGAVKKYFLKNNKYSA